ncbi:hypothetical protein [Thiocapsa bogorovii]|uniref:hypothetical protein n=1 Tax=Thiocapsa bogorovii TaxID=521689 RepID=UPI001E332C01|nr:hypothetical protein [Thiocapsa bogorovii]UHD14504.1 hypothetical protein LT988_14470 [Thiocapsa bogorovii]
MPVELFVMAGGLDDETPIVTERWRHQPSGWRSAPDDGEAGAISEGTGSGI